MPFQRFDGLQDTIQLFIPCQDYECSIRSRLVELSVRFQAAVYKHLVVFCTDPPVLCVSSFFNQSILGLGRTNRIDGGEPAGIKTLPGDEGCRRNNMIINIKAIKGKTSTRASGTDTVFICIRRRSKPLGEKRLVFCDTSLKEFGNDGGCICFVRRSTKPIGAFGWGGGESGIVSGMLTAGGLGRDTVERRRGLSRPLRVSSFVMSRRSRLQMCWCYAG
jgi:hypothetical protein